MLSRLPLETANKLFSKAWSNFNNCHSRNYSSASFYKIVSVWFLFIHFKNQLSFSMYSFSSVFFFFFWNHSYLFCICIHSTCLIVRIVHFIRIFSHSININSISCLISHLHFFPNITFPSFFDRFFFLCCFQNHSLLSSYPVIGIPFINTFGMNNCSFNGASCGYAHSKKAGKNRNGQTLKETRLILFMWAENIIYNLMADYLP